MFNYYVYRTHKDRKENNLAYYNKKMLVFCLIQVLAELIAALVLILFSKRDFFDDGETESDRVLDKLANNY